MTILHDLNVDLHTHSKASDGSLSPSEVMERALSNDVDIVALTDHDTIEGVHEAMQYTEGKNIYFIPGVEISTSWAGVCIHVLGLNINPNDEQLKKFLLNMNFDPEQIKSSGLFIKSNRDKNYFGRFRDRVLFPIYNFSENIIGFGERTFVNSKIKYINSPESIFFKKSENLFGFKQNVESIKNLKEIIIVEGYLDVISLNSKKIFNSVATLGTSLSENQILRAWNYSNNPILCFDGDEAGLNAMEKVAFKILNFLKPGKSVRFLELPEEMDPDNFINLKGKEQFIELKNKSKTLSNFIWQIILKQCGADTPENIALMDEKIIKISNQIKHKNLSLEYLRFLRNKKNEFFGNKRITSSRGFLKKK